MIFTLQKSEFFLLHQLLFKEEIQASPKPMLYTSGDCNGCDSFSSKETVLTTANCSAGFGPTLLALHISTKQFFSSDLWLMIIRGVPITLSFSPNKAL